MGIPDDEAGTADLAVNSFIGIPFCPHSYPQTTSIWFKVEGAVHFVLASSNQSQEGGSQYKRVSKMLMDTIDYHSAPSDLVELAKESRPSLVVPIHMVPWAS